jgi:hypothetical protein
MVVIQPQDETLVLYDSIPRTRTKVFNLIKGCVDITMDIWTTERIARCTIQVDNESSALFLLLNTVAHFIGMENPVDMYKASHLPALRKWLALALLKMEVNMGDRVYRP